MKNRSRVEILYDIIDASRTTAKKTHLMYRSNLSFKQLDMYLHFLLQRELVEERLDVEDASKSYAITPKGMEFLSLFESLQDLMGVKPQEAVDEEEFLVTSVFMGPQDPLLVSRPVS
jgi:predicted transcriptional regulator